MNRMALDVESVKAFIYIIDFQSFTKAADALGTTQGAISVKLRRLEERLGYKLIERTPRLVRLSAQGTVFINAAREFIAAHDRAIAALSCECRRFRLGIAEHVAGPEIPALLAKLNERDPALTIEIRLENSTQLLEAFDSGELDAVIVRQDDDYRSGEDLGPEHFGWFAASNFHQQQGKPLKLASLAPCCRSRNIAIDALDNAGIEWVEVFVGGGNVAIMAAVSAGLAVSAFSCRLAPPNTIEVGKKFELPDLPSSRIILHSKLTDQRSKEALRTLAAAYREHGTS
ncbi:LysR family transcriptional regulator [Xenorhabdus hominickii]|uniref:LysR family transcriptional regulator n=1 Tax=Xenorhabdus hominickii TaxID=351679 RepID=A0A2G0Q1K4_XENHO|nr:LysR family transcriptional regulator [Xenorhabdus hominickii]AOM40385.1 LysR family transcriptional regulator [Xenorhabdus hominickii]PHM53097.1 LysR family transcriptional regulator [Xenorhabdus hominickii]